MSERFTNFDTSELVALENALDSHLTKMGPLRKQAICEPILAEIRAALNGDTP